MYSSNGFCKNSCLYDKFLAPRPFQIQCGSVNAVLAAECPTKSSVIDPCFNRHLLRVGLAYHSLFPKSLLLEFTYSLSLDRWSNSASATWRFHLDGQQQLEAIP